MSQDRSPTSARAGAFPRKTWIFQANPNKYRIKQSLQIERAEYWNLNQHAQDVGIGDRILLWISGSAAGIYAVGTVLTSPVPMPDSATGLAYWQDPLAGRRIKPRVLVRYDHVFLNQPLRKAYLEADPELWDLRILRLPRGTNFVVSDDQWRALEGWLLGTAYQP